MISDALVGLLFAAPAAEVLDPAPAFEFDASFCAFLTSTYLTPVGAEGKNVSRGIEKI